MDKIIRCITSDGAVMVSAIDSTDIAYKASIIHHTSPVASAALGRLLSAASMMGAQLKSSKSTLNIRFEGDGELGAFLAVADSIRQRQGLCHQSRLPDHSLRERQAERRTGSRSRHHQRDEGFR